MSSIPPRGSRRRDRRGTRNLGDAPPSLLPTKALESRSQPEGPRDEPLDLQPCSYRNDPRPGLEGALDELLTYVRDTTELSTTISFDRWAPIEDDRKSDHVLHVVREAVENVVRHSGARHLVLALSLRGNLREVYVADDGRGAAVNPAAGPGSGLRQMERSAQLLGGALCFERRRSRGLAVRLVFPA